MPVRGGRGGAATSGNSRFSGRGGYDHRYNSRFD